MTTVAQLIEQLQKLPQEYEVVLSKDAEGNDFSPYYDWGTGIYIPGTTWAGEFHDVDEYNGYSDFDEDDDAEYIPENAVCLWPVN